MIEELFSPSVNKLIDEIEQWYADADARFLERVREIGKKEFDGQIASCFACTRPGCCYQKTQVYFAEILPIARRMATDDITQELLAQFKELGERMEGSTTSGWLSSQTPCIFLKDNRCLIYEQRPVRCRTYYVYTPAENCSGPPRTPITQVDSLAIDNAWLKTAMNVHRILRLHETKKRILLATLPRALHIFFEAKDADDFPKTVAHQTWPSDTGIIERNWLEGNNPFLQHGFRDDSTSGSTGGVQ